MERENDELLEAIRRGLEEGAAVRRAMESGVISEAAAEAAVCADPPRRGEFRAVRPDGDEEDCDGGHSPA